MIKLLSSDLNGTLVHQHTMSDMIQLFIGEQQYQQANEAFKRQTSGTASMEDAFGIVGPLTKGLTLRQAIEYTRAHMTYVDGFPGFVDTLAQHGIPLVINSTGYSVTIYAIREQIGKFKIHGSIRNFLRFGVNADIGETLTEEELERKVKAYFLDSESVNYPMYDKIQATGAIDLGITDEEAKPRLILEYAVRYFGSVQPSEIAHIGDTMADSGCIYGVAKMGGLGIAFNYNPALERFVKETLASETLPGRMVLVDPKSRTSSLMHVVPHILNRNLSTT